ncbi:MAG: heme lyase CcmF/NrfE family subunit, partial [Gammaproteobacteria bacterium]|nr:heme lyase CcmF/NrfE family subunit [Gammaproteobacteria bacterium]
MLAELGQVTLVLALLLALLLAILPLWGSYNNNQQLQLLSRPLSYGVLGFIGLAFVLLTSAFISQDFSLQYVAQNSNSLLPVHYRISAVWGGHEGSLLLWCLVLAFWIAAVARFSNALPLQFLARVSAVLGMVAAAFLLFVLFTSNPFGRLLPMPVDGADLNPLLQDPGLIIHPPILYMGYVGMAVPFAFAIAALLGGRMETTWVRWCRPWTLSAWAFLTGGIALGSWWAYYELGWGGWWFWDPVENASFMPWLIGTALVHSLAVTEKRKVFQNWTLLLAITAFSLSLLGTFLVRSGALTSVHAFASDPTRGIFVLAMLGFFCGGALTLFAVRAHTLKPEAAIGLYSRETMLLLNNVFFAAATGMVLLGTLYPLLADALDLGKISVGPPYFGLLFMLLMVPVVLLIPLGPMTRWRQGDWSEIKAQARNMALAAAGLLLLLGL